LGESRDDHLPLRSAWDALRRSGCGFWVYNTDVFVQYKFDALIQQLVERDAPSLLST
jgi:hypothetical protein